MNPILDLVEFKKISILFSLIFVLLLQKSEYLCPYELCGYNLAAAA